MKTAIELIERGTVKEFEEAYGGQTSMLQDLVTDSMGLFRGTLLHYAVNYRKLSFVKYFVALGADIESTLGTGHTPLYEAILSRSTTIAQYLMEQGANIHTKDRNNRTLFYALVQMRYGDRSTTKIKLLKFLLSLDLDINERDNWGRTVLYELLRWNEPKVLNALLEGGADLQISDRYGYTPLHIAAGNGWPEICQILLKQGVPINATNQYGWTALDIARINQSKQTIAFFEAAHANEANTSIVQLMTKLMAGQVDNLLPLLKKADHLNYYNYDKMSLLNLCIRGDQDELAKEILNKKNVIIEGALGMACIRQNTKLVQLLLERGADPNEKQAGCSPLYNLFIFPNTKNTVGVLQLLLKYGAVFDPEETNFRGRLGDLIQKVKDQTINNLLEIKD
ncbi:ankyrin repeat domain-containing protein [Aureispira anguillae]|uniref:Ankyrin repeat domain-containing protein n=1 Tax=Aureispira anguillae TaxID=2864201 RepID=A0A915YEW9_9BACT|nr:ankyrin repeat domain-containing protein [Aureispira anguillae]BDS11867.1 ankyrin repeat domain-containing protein [Aureispira anguillae]